MQGEGKLQAAARIGNAGSSSTALGEVTSELVRAHANNCQVKALLFVSASNINFGVIYLVFLVVFRDGYRATVCAIIARL